MNNLDNKMRMDKGKKGLTGGVLMLLLAGCQAPGSPKLPPPDDGKMQAWAEEACVKPEGISHSDCIYAAKLQYGIQHNFYDVKQYKGRECMLTIRYNEKGRYDVQRTSGDELLCKKAWSVVSSADKLPPPPPGAPEKLILDFKPGG